MLSVLFRFTDFDYPVGIFKLFLHEIPVMQNSIYTVFTDITAIPVMQRSILTNPKS
jgi:hypothetical protein